VTDLWVRGERLFAKGLTQEGRPPLTRGDDSAEIVPPGVRNFRQ